jgi:hypothetical protein
MLFTLASTVLSKLPPSGETKKELLIPWEEWGPTKARLVEEAPHPMEGFMCFVYGLRYASILEGPDGDLISILDFNPFTISQPLSIVTEDSPVQEVLYTNPSVVGGFGEVQSDTSQWFETSLPYRQILRKTDVRYQGVMMDVERLIGVKVSCLNQVSSWHLGPDNSFRG